MAARVSICRLEVFLVSLAALLLEISYTRIFSFKASSYFTYLLIGFALLGIGSGGVLMSIAPRWRRRCRSMSSTRSVELTAGPQGLQGWRMLRTDSAC